MIEASSEPLAELVELDDEGWGFRDDEYKLFVFPTLEEASGAWLMRHPGNEEPSLSPRNVRFRPVPPDP